MIKMSERNKVNRCTYEQYIAGYIQWKKEKAKEREYLHLQELYNSSPNETEKKALKRALYQMEVE